MNRTEIIEKIIERFKCEPYEAPLSILKQILSEELPDFQRIDEERFKRIYASKVCDIGLHIKEYNSTLLPALVPLPKEMPTWFDKKVSEWMNNSNIRLNQVWHELISHYGTPPNNLQPLPKEVPEWFHGGHNFYKLWSLVCHNYGTPEPKPNLPTVEELAKEIAGISVPIVADKKLSRVTAEYIIDKYSLPTREWWQDCEKFMYKGRAYKKYSHEVFPDGRTVLHSELAGHNLIYCTPYTPPSAQEIIAKHNLSDEEVKILREGKCT